MSRELLRAIAERLREERVLMGLSQQCLAVMVGVSRQQIINYETARCEMSVSVLAKLHELVFDVQYIVTGVRSENFFEWE